jgi:phosphatidylserine/phosphatidylglycerophosphate/cardiolipin synthase-like enzyme
VGLLDNSTDSIDVQQVTIGQPGNPLIQAILRAARRGVRVRRLLSGAWYARDENRAMAETLRGVAKRESLPLEVRLVNPAGRFGKLHSKGNLLDVDQAVVGSINWNNNFLPRNHEVAVVLDGDEAGAYYTKVFIGDWRGGHWQITVGLIGLAVGTVVGASLWARSAFEFERPTTEADGHGVAADD